MRERCYQCFRPLSLCFCDAIPRIENRTDVLILQHVGERFHPFNTARIVQKALRHCRLIADHNQRLGTSSPADPGQRRPSISPDKCSFVDRTVCRRAPGTVSDYRWYVASSKDDCPRCPSTSGPAMLPIDALLSGAIPDST